MSAQMEFALVFTGRAENLKAAATDAKQAVAAVGDEAEKATADLNAHAAALEKDTAATQKAAEAKRRLASEEKSAREAAARASGALPAGTAPHTPHTQPAPSVPPPAVPPRPEPQPPSPPPANDNSTRFRRQVLGYQGFDIGQGLAGGMPLGMIAAQQGPQIAQLYMGQGGGLKTFLGDVRAMAGGALGMITPLTAGIAALAGAALVGAAAYGSYLASTKEVETASAGLGRAVAGTRAEMEASAHAGAAAAGISVASARSMQAQFLRTGRIGSEHYEELIALSKDFAVTIGVDADAAGEALADMFADPAKAAQTLYRQYGLIDAATARHVSNLAAQNRQSEAQAALLEALPGQLADAEQATTALGRAWNAVSTAAAGAYDWIGRTIDRMVDGPSLDEQIADARNTMNGWGLDAPFGQDAKKKLDELLAEQKRLTDAETARREAAEKIARTRAAVAAAESSPANDNRLREQKLRNELEALRSRQNDLAPGSFDRAMVDQAIEAKTRALDGLITKQSRAVELDRLEIQIANERNPLLRAELEARRVRLQMAEQEVSADTVATEAARERNRVIEETMAQGSAQAADMSAEVETRQRLAAQVASGAMTAEDANRVLQEELFLRPLIAAAAVAEGAEKERLIGIIQQLRDGYAAMAAQQKDQAAQDYLRSGRERMEQLRVEQALLGANADVRERTLALLRAEQQIRSMGIDPSSPRASQIRSQADDIARVTSELEKQQAAWADLQSAGEQAIDGVMDKLFDGDFAGAAEELAKQVGSFFGELAKNDMKNAALGTDYTTLDDLDGITGIFKRLFGAGAQPDPASIVSQAVGQSVGAMNVNAGVVTINGAAIGGEGGALGTLTKLLNPANGNSPTTAATTSTAASSAMGQALSFVGNYKSGVDNRLTEILQEAATRFPGFKVDAISGFRPGDSRFHGRGLATDVSLTNLLTGQKLGNYQDASTFRDYEKFAQVAQQVASERGLGDELRWGGYFGGARGKYGAMDTMHFDLAGRRVGMGGGSWEDGLNAKQRAMWPGAESVGMGKSANEAAQALDKLATSSTTANQGLQTAAEGLGQLGSGFDQFGKNLSNLFPSAPAGGGSALSGLSALMGLDWSFAGSSAFWNIVGGGTGAYAEGIENAPPGWAWVGEEGPELMRLKGGETIRSSQRSRQMAGHAAGQVKGGYAMAGGFTFAPVIQAPPAPAERSRRVVVNDYAGVSVRHEERDDGADGIADVLIIEKHTAAAMSRTGSEANKVLRAFGGRPPRPKG